LVTLLLLNLLWLSYALGGVRLWGEMTALALSVGTLFLLPRWKTGEIPGTPSPVERLLRLPLFWFGFGLYAYMFIQSWNLAWDWTLVPDGRPKLVSQEPLVSWLPTGLESPFEESNPVRYMLFYAIPWLACCSAWAGLMTRRAVALLLHGIALCGVAFAFVALRQHFLDIDKILGIFPTVPKKQGVEIPFWGTLINENHAAFYLILANGLCLGLFLSGWHQAMLKFKRGGGAWMLYMGLAFMTTFAVLMAQARGAIVFVVLQWVLFIIICSVFFIRHFGLRGSAFPVTIVILFAVIGGIFVGNPTVFERQKAEWTRTFDLMENPELEARYYMMQIGRDMIRDKPWFGHGAGGFRYLHFPYKAAYPEFRTEYRRWLPNPVTGKREVRTVTVWFQNAHVDLMEYVIEWGIVGCLFPLAAILWLLYRAASVWRGMDSGLLTIIMTVCVVFLGAAVEFHFRIPLVLLAWCLALTTTVKLAELRSR
jgi:O-antigen ligase